MTRYKTFIPTALVILRFILGPLIWWSVELDLSRLWFLGGFFIAFVSDIFDGIIARRLNVSTPALRFADGWVDTWFYGWMVASIWTAHQDILIDFSRPILILLFIQVSEWIFSLVKFGKSTSYHVYSAKLFGIAPLIAIVNMMGFKFVGWVFGLR
jgi:phosphatidylglycerophosphate synthase